MGEGRGVHRVLVGKPEGKRPQGRPRRRLEDNIRWMFRKWKGVVGTGWSWLRVGTVGTCEYGEEPSGSKNSWNFLTSCRTS
jgi:hypothetical protein